MIFRIFVFTTILLLSQTMFAATCVTDICPVPAGATTHIDKFGICYDITNSGASDLMVGTKTQAEYESFANTPAIAGITKVSCTPPYYVASRKISGWSSGLTMDIAKPLGLAVGDIMLAIIYQEATLATATPPSGFTAMYTNYKIDGAWRSSSYYKLATAGDVAASNFTFTHTTTWHNAAGFITAYRNVNQVTPIANMSHALSSSTSPIAWTSATVTTANSTVVIFGQGVSAPAVPATYTKPEATFFDSVYTLVAAKTVAAPGATGSFTSTSMADWAATLIILNPK